MTKRKTYTIDESKWRSASCGEGPTLLLNQQGYMCCLGQVMEQDGAKGLLEESFPHCVSESLTGPHWTVDRLYFSIRNSAMAGEMMNVNDSDALNHDERKRRLTELFDEAGFDLEFVGDPVLRPVQ